MSAWDNNGTSVKISKDASNYIEIIMTIEGNAEHNVSGKYTKVINLILSKVSLMVLKSYYNVGFLII